MSAPIIAKRNAFTQADVVDGGTVVIAGLRQENFVNEEQGIPWLSKIPVLGWLFKNDFTEKQKRELVVFLTAKVVTSPGQAAAPPSVLPTAPGMPVPPGPSGQVSPSAPTPVSAAPTPTSAVPTPAPAPASIATASTKTVTAAAPTATLPSRAPAGRPTPAADPTGER